MVAFESRMNTRVQVVVGASRVGANEATCFFRPGRLEVTIASGKSKLVGFGITKVLEHLEIGN